jgi:hypothetical protein
MAGIAAPQLSVVVTIAPGQTPDATVYFPAVSPLGQMLAAMLPRHIAVRHAADAANNVPALLSLPHWVVASLFLARSTFSHDFGSHPAKPSVLNASFTPGFWSRVISHYVDRGLLQEELASTRDIRAAVLALEVDDATLVIAPADLAPSAPLDVPAVTGPPTAARAAVAAVAAVGRGRNGTAAVQARAAVPAAPGPTITPAVLGPIRLSFFALSPLASFEDQGNSRAPLTGLSFLLSHLGPTFSPAPRTDTSGILQSAAEIVRLGLTAKFGNVLGEGALARQLPGFINEAATNFTHLLTSDSLEPAVLEDQLSSAVRLLTGSADDRVSIERHRAIHAIQRVSS